MKYPIDYETGRPSASIAANSFNSRNSWLKKAYICDASGDCMIKSTGDGQAIYVNGFSMGGSGTVGNYTMYVNPFMVVQNAKYTKHFYIEGQRIVSKLGEIGTEQDLLQPKSHAGDSLKNPVNWNNKKELSKDIIVANFEALGLSGAVVTAGKSGKMPYGQLKKYYKNTDAVITGGNNTSSTSKKTEDLQFYYHLDHLGSSNYITDASGEAYQHEEYFPFGETFVEERTDAEYTTYLFNGKELDEETGLYYYGSRYYDPRTSVWQSIDPHAENYYAWSPYHYASNNPIVVMDPNGMDWYISNSGKEKGQYKWFDGSEKQKGYTNVGNYKTEFDKDKNSIIVYEGKDAKLKETISMEVEKDGKGNFLRYKDDRAAKFAMISAESGGVNVNDKDPFFDPLIISASIDNRQKVADAGYNSFTSSEGQAYKGYYALKYKAYKDFARGNQKRFNGNLYQQNLSLSTVYNAMDNPVMNLESNYSIKDAKYLLYYSHLGGNAQGGSAFNITYPTGKSDRFVSVQGDTKFKTILDK